MADEKMLLLRSSFPVTGQPVRVIMIAGAPWFATADVCKVLGRGNPSWASKLVGPGGDAHRRHPLGNPHFK